MEQPTVQESLQALAANQSGFQDAVVKDFKMMQQKIRDLAFMLFLTQAFGIITLFTLLVVYATHK